MAKLPHLADVQCTSMQFKPGDRILVKLQPHPTGKPHDKEYMAKARKIVEKWAGDHVEVLVIDLGRVNLEVLRASNATSVYGSK